MTRPPHDSSPESNAVHDAPPLYLVESDEETRQQLSAWLATRGFEVQSFDSLASFQSSGYTSTRGCLFVRLESERDEWFGIMDDLASRYPRLDVVVLSAPGQTPNLAHRLAEGTVQVLDTVGDRRTVLGPVLDGLRSPQRLRRETIREAVRSRMALLTAREREVLTLITEGKSNKVIASELSISPKTVEVHRSQVMRKMEAASLASLVRMVVLVESGS